MAIQLTSDEILKRYRALPQELKDAIEQIELGDGTDKIGEGAGLTKQEQQLLSVEVSYVLAKISPLDGFAAALQDNLKLTPEVSKKISDEVNQKIFDKVRSYITGEIKGTYAPAELPENLPTGPVNALSVTGNTNTQDSVPNLVTNKLSGMTRIPHESISVSDKNSALGTQAMTEPAEMPKKPTYQGIDPYREPPK